MVGANGVIRDALHSVPLCLVEKMFPGLGGGAGGR